MSKHDNRFYEWILENYNLGNHIPGIEYDKSLEVPARTYYDKSDSTTTIGINARKIFNAEGSFLDNYPESPQFKNVDNTGGYINRGLTINTDSNQVKPGLLEFILGHEVGHVLPTAVNNLSKNDPNKIEFDRLDKKIPQTKEGKADLMSLGFWQARNNNFPATVKFPEDTAGYDLIQKQIALFRKKGKF